MQKIAAIAGATVLGLSAQVAYGYGGTANLTFSWATGGTDKSWTSSGSNTLGTMSNSTYFSALGGNNATAYYNSDFASNADCATIVAGLGGTPTGTRKYGCRYNTSSGTPAFAATAVTDAGPGAQASGTLTVTDTTLTGTLTLIATTDEPTGGTAASIGNGSNGFNTRSADGSPFGNVWYGISSAATISVNLTGTFTASSWQINGGWARFTDTGAQCQQGGFSTPNNILCLASTAAGGHTATQAEYSWGWDTDGGQTGASDMQMIEVRDASNNFVATLSGVLASLSIDGLGNVTTNQGEFRRASAATVGGVTNCGLGPTQDHIRWNGSSMSCGTLAAGDLVITGTAPAAVVPVPAAVWLMGSALGLLGWIRRKAA